MLAHLPPHPNVVQYYTCWSEAGAGELGEHLYIQLEKCDVNLGIHASLGEQLKEADLLEVLEQVRPGRGTGGGRWGCVGAAGFSLHAGVRSGAGAGGAGGCLG